MKSAIKIARKKSHYYDEGKRAVITCQPIIFDQVNVSWLEVVLGNHRTSYCRTVQNCIKPLQILSYFRIEDNERGKTVWLSEIKKKEAKWSNVLFQSCNVKKYEFFSTINASLKETLIKCPDYHSRTSLVQPQNTGNLQTWNTNSVLQEVESRNGNKHNRDPKS